MKKSTVTVSLDRGFDARELAMCVQLAGKFRSDIHLTDKVRRMNAKSIMGMMALGIALGDEITIEAEGNDEDEAVEALSVFLSGK